MLNFGNYPKEYNRAVHGPYYPWIDYRPGPKDTPFYDVKLGELKKWIGRRDKKPYAIIANISRYASWYAHKWNHPIKGSPSKMIIHGLAVSSLISLYGCYHHIKHERLHKYHW